jgi:hypothetical protein
LIAVKPALVLAHRLKIAAALDAHEAALAALDAVRCDAA